MNEDVFTPAEVLSLNGYQACGVMHPFTCGSGNRTEHPDHEGLLVATTKGWVCPYCDYRQDWAHDSMKNGAWRKSAREIMQFSVHAEPASAEEVEKMRKALQAASHAKGKEARERLAKAFRDAGDELMAQKAEEGYYGDFTSPLATPILQLVADCNARGYRDIARRAMDGDFDG